MRSTDLKTRRKLFLYAVIINLEEVDLPFESSFSPLRLSSYIKSGKSPQTQEEKYGWLWQQVGIWKLTRYIREHNIQWIMRRTNEIVAKAGGGIVDQNKALLQSGQKVNRRKLCCCRASTPTHRAAPGGFTLKVAESDGEVLVYSLRYAQPGDHLLPTVLPYDEHLPQGRHA